MSFSFVKNEMHHATFSCKSSSHKRFQKRFKKSSLMSNYLLDFWPRQPLSVLADTKRFSPPDIIKLPRPARLLSYFHLFVNVEKFAWPCWKTTGPIRCYFFLIMSVRRKKKKENRHISDNWPRSFFHWREAARENCLSSLFFHVFNKKVLWHWLRITARSTG